MVHHAPRYFTIQFSFFVVTDFLPDPFPQFLFNALDQCCSIRKVEDLTKKNKKKPVTLSNTCKTGLFFRLYFRYEYELFNLY